MKKYLLGLLLCVAAVSAPIKTNDIRLDEQQLTGNYLENLQLATVRINCFSLLEGANGTGFVIGENADCYYILTDRHVVLQTGTDNEYNQIFVMITTKKDGYVKQFTPMVKAKVVLKSDPKTDLALLAVSKTNAYFPLKLHFSNIEMFPVGKTVHYCGNYDGAVGIVTQGIISNYAITPSGPMMTVDINIIPGCSGGPLVNNDGLVIGILQQCLNKDNHIAFFRTSGFITDWLKTTNYKFLLQH